MASIGNIPDLGIKLAHIADAETSHSITDAATELDAANELELEGFYDALGTKINEILTALEKAGILSVS